MNTPNNNYVIDTAITGTSNLSIILNETIHVAVMCVVIKIAIKCNTIQTVAQLFQ